VPRSKNGEKNEKRNRQRSKNRENRNLLFHSRLMSVEVRMEMFDYMTLVWIGLGGASLAFAFLQYAFAYGKKVKAEPC
jgi:hypothetical protein